MGDDKKTGLVQFSISAPGKLILFGEHSVVYGKSALAASISKRTYIHISEQEDSSEKLFTLRMKEIDFNLSIPLEHVNSILKEPIPSNNEAGVVVDGVVNPRKIDHEKFLLAIEDNAKKYFGDSFNKMSKEQQMSLKVFFYFLHGVFYETCRSKEKSVFTVPFTVNITTELSIGAGTGSSASFCVCVAAALHHYKNIKLRGQTEATTISFNEKGIKLISDWSFSGEKVLHGRPSGIDNAVATYGSFITVQTSKDAATKKFYRSFLDLKRPPKMQVILINSGISRNTLKMVERAALLKAKYTDAVGLVLDAMSNVCERAIESIAKLSAAEVSPETTKISFRELEILVDMNQGLLYSLGVSHVSLQDICATCSKFGLHAKLTGAGGGGNAFAFVPADYPTCKLAACREALHDKGYSNDCMYLGSEGVKLEK